MPNLITLDELKEATGFKRCGDIERWLSEHGIPFFTAKSGKVFTTPEKMNEALSIVEKNKTKIKFG